LRRNIGGTGLEWRCGVSRQRFSRCRGWGGRGDRGEFSRRDHYLSTDLPHRRSEKRDGTCCRQHELGINGEARSLYLHQLPS